jgi:hypothetical protein
MASVVIAAQRSVRQRILTTALALNYKAKGGKPVGQLNYDW